ncbi:MAG: VanZ family protein [Firmicutes bacterium]|nr:VanZ family protein [Bacillota bacterium]
MFLFAKCPQSSAYSMAEQLFEWFPFLAEADIPVLVFYIRKFLHVLGYFIGTCIIFYAVKITPVFKRAVYISTLGLALLLAILDEWYQTTLPHRSGRIEDVFIDLIGITVALLLLKHNSKASGFN